MTLLDNVDMLFATTTKNEEEVMEMLSEYLNNMYFA